MTTDRSTAGSVEPDDRVGQRGSWNVWRQDDNGNHFVVARFDVRADAEALAATMEARGHKQMYWVATTG